MSNRATVRKAKETGRPRAAASPPKRKGAANGAPISSRRAGKAAAAAPVEPKEMIQPRTKPADVRRDELMDAAATLFVDKGVEATIVDEIVAAANVAKGTFYQYFNSKNDMVAALRERFSARFLARTQEAVDSCPKKDWNAKIRSWTVAGVDAYLDDFKLHDVVSHEHYHRGTKEKNAVLEQLIEILDEGIKAGAWSIDDSRMAAILIFQGLHGAVDDAIVSGDSNRWRITRTLSALFLRMLGTK